MLVFFCKQKTAYEMRISDGSSDVCSSDLDRPVRLAQRVQQLPPYLFARISQLIAEKRAAGVDVISLGIGDPDLPTPPHILDALKAASDDPRSDERRVGNECVSTCRSRCSPYHEKKNNRTTHTATHT